jgi:hypothetical protein
MRRKPSHMPTGRLQSLRLFSTLLPIALRTPLMSAIACKRKLRATAFGVMQKKAARNRAAVASEPWLLLFPTF